ncbi:MAG: bifunctional metallophosphatase/5'-nucleotidase [Ignavibacteriaceae bacterium]|nr:bifunctional metallophosphatase/5'-nucleotidase [Ignavibacteriaceae bacterium]
MLKLKTLSIIVLSFVLLSATSSAQTVRLKIVETSDVHGAIFPYDFKNDIPFNYSLAQVQTFVEQERKQNPDGVILLDNGDILQGQPVVYYYNFEKQDTLHLLSQVMNYMKYDAAAVGNHDIETGHPVYDKFNSELNFPWLAANAINTKTDEPYFKPYSIITRQGVKVAVLGLITPAIPNWLPEDIWKDIFFDDMIKSAKKWVAIIKREEKPDMIVGLFHSGVDYTYNNETKEKPFNENAAQLVAEQVPGFDLVFVGHDHKGWNYTVTSSNGKTVLILGTKSEARTAAAADVLLEFDKSTGIWEKKITGSILNVGTYKPDSTFISKFNYGFSQTRTYVNKELCILGKTITTRDALLGPSYFTDLIHRFQLDITDADVSFAAPLSFDAELKKGKIYVRDMFELYKYENLLYTVKLSGKEIKDYLEYSYGLWYNTMRNKNDDLLLFKTNSDGKKELKNQYYNFSSAAGINYSVDVTKLIGSRINIISMSSGQPFYSDSTYLVAINSYRGNGGGGHLITGAKIPKEELQKRIVKTTNKDLRFYLMRWMMEKKLVVPKFEKNCSVIPKDFFWKGRKRAYKDLFPKKQKSGI